MTPSVLFGTSTGRWTTRPASRWSGSARSGTRSSTASARSSPSWACRRAADPAPTIARIDVLTDPPAPAPGALRRVLLVLCLTEITSWGVLYYAFPVLAPRIGADTGWSQPLLTAAFSAGQVVAALTGIGVGRLLDRHGPRWLMTAGSVLGTLALVAVAAAPSPALFVAAWLLAGVATAGTLYPPAFAALTRWYGPARVRALTTLTLVGGLASTVFAPVTAALAGRLGWRGTYLVLAAVLAAVTIPAHAAGLRLPWPPLARARGGADPGADRISRSRPYLALVTAFTLAAFAVYGTVITTVPLLTGRGLSTQAAALLLGLGGVGQVTGRLGYARIARGRGATGRTVVVLATAAAGIALLGIVPGPAGVLAVLIFGVGTSRGVYTLVSATAITDRWGTRHYGRLSGLLVAPGTIAAALSPFAATALAGALGGYPAVYLILAGCALAAALLALAGAP
jgi:MFS family permease